MASRAIDSLTRKDEEIAALHSEIEDLKVQLATKPKFITEKDYKSQVAPPPPPPRSQDFVSTLLALDPDAAVIVAGDCNEYAQTRSVFAPLDGLLTELDVAADVPPVERYTYVFDQNSQQLDHLFVSSAIVARGTGVEHVHVNNWAASVGAMASDHDPSVAQARIC